MDLEIKVGLLGQVDNGYAKVGWVGGKDVQMDIQMC